MNSSTLAAGCDDAAFGPIIHGCRQDFDFTLAFEQYFFSVAPSAVLLLTAPIRIALLRRQPAKVTGAGLRLTKVSVCAAWACLQLALLVLCASQQHVQGSRHTTLAAVAVSLAASLALVPLSHIEHVRSLRPSLLVNAYLLITILLDVAIIRTLWLMPTTNHAIRSIFTASFATKVVLFVLEAVEKRRFFLPPYQKRSPEESSGLLSQGLLWWLNDLIFFGARHLLKPERLYPITADMSSEKLSARFWAIMTDNDQNHIRPGLKKALFRLLWWPILLPILPRLALLTFTLCQPLLIRRLLVYLADPTERQDARLGYALIGAAGIIYVSMAVRDPPSPQMNVPDQENPKVSAAIYWHRHYRFMAMIRGTLTTAVYRKAMSIRSTAASNAKTVTLMSADCERITRGLMDLHELWANIAQVAIATYLIETQVGVACVAPIAVTLVTTGLTGYAAQFMPGFQVQWLEQLESRIGVTSSIIGSFKAIKITNLANKALTLLHKLREDELAAAAKFRYITVITATIAVIPQLISPVITFAVFISVSRNKTSSLDPARMFTSLSLLLLVAEPLFSLFSGLMDFMTAIGSLGRIEKFLLTPDQMDKRKLQSLQTRLSSEDRTSLGAAQSPQQALHPHSRTDDVHIDVQNGSFGWTEDGESILRKLNFTVKAGEIVFVMGPVACGKSTLMKGLLGETPCLEGEVAVAHPEIAFCDQSPWITNGSIRSNITFSSPLDAALYDMVIHCCDLAFDIATLAQGDATVIGSKGFSLSAGQRQRVALARAVYSRKKIALLDDVFSQLDASTQTKIASRLLGPEGLYRRWGTTVILTTTSDIFSSLADNIIILNQSGEIAQQGNHTALGLENGSVYRKSRQSNDEIGAAASLDNDSPAKAATGEKEKQGNNVEYTTGEAPVKPPRTDFSVYRYYFSTVSSKKAVVFVVFQICLAFLSSFPFVWLKWWSDSNTDVRDSRTGYYIGVYSAMQGAALVASGLVTWWTLNVLAVTTGFQLHATLAKTLMRATLKLVGTTEGGGILNRFTQDIQLADVQLPLALQVVVTNLLIGIAQAGLIASASAWIAVSYPFLVAVFFIIPKYYVRTARQIRTLDLEQKAPLYAQFLETLEGMTSIRAFSWQGSSFGKNYELVDQSQKPFYLMYVIQKWLSLVLDMAIAGLAVLVVGVAVALRDTVSAGFTGVSLTQIVSFTSYLKMMILFWAQLQTAMAAVERIHRFSRDTEEESCPDPAYQPLPEWPARGEVRIQGLSARYKDDSQSTVLSDVNLEIGAGEKVCICGRTGSGKSSLVLILLRLLDPFEGTITIDGIDIVSLSRDLVRARIIGVAEEPFFFPGTVRQNMDPYGEVADDAMVQALVDMSLWRIFETHGLDTKLDKEMMSHGQRQLFNIARALLRSGNLVVFDEVTSSLDKDAEAVVNRVIQTRLKYHTVISVVHKLDFALLFDKVIVMDQGHVVEFGAPAILMEGESKFRKLYESQRPVSD